VLLLTPLLVASGVQHERDSRSVDLLALTGLGPRSILIEQAGSKLLMVLLTVLAGLPLYGLVMGLGGFSIQEVFSVNLVTVTAAVTLAWFSTWVALVVRRGPLVPVTLSWAYLGGLGLLTTVWADLEPVTAWMRSMSHVSDTTRMVRNSTLLFGWLGVLAASSGLFAPAFRVVATHDDQEEEFGLHSPEIWAIERYRRHTRMLWVAAMLCAVLTWMLSYLLFRAVALLGICHAVVGLTTLLALNRQSLLWVLDGTRWIEGLLSAPIRLTRTPRLGNRRVWTHPVLWRELVTRGAGGTRLLPLALGGMWAAAAFSVLHRGDGPALMALTGVYGGALVASMVATSLAIDDTREERMALLALTRVTPWRMALAKLVAPSLFALPLHLMGFAVLFRALDPELATASVALASALWVVVWTANISAISATGALVARTRSAGWVLGAGAGATWALTPLLLLFAFDALPVLQDLLNRDLLMSTWMPIFKPGVWEPAESGSLHPAWLAAISQSCLLLLTTLGLCRGIRSAMLR
jgi:hypothetical protein